MNCKPKDDEVIKVKWIKINGAWVPAITVCYLMKTNRILVSRGSFNSAFSIDFSNYRDF